jgi:hypothetical protein
MLIAHWLCHSIVEIVVILVGSRACCQVLVEYRLAYLLLAMSTLQRCAVLYHFLELLQLFGFLLQYLTPHFYFVHRS